MSALVSRATPQHRSLWLGLAVVLPAVLDLLDPALLTGLGVLLLTLINGMGA